MEVSVVTWASGGRFYFLIIIFELFEQKCSGRRRHHGNDSVPEIQEILRITCNQTVCLQTEGKQQHINTVINI